MSTTKKTLVFNLETDDPIGTNDKIGGNKALSYQQQNFPNAEFISIPREILEGGKGETRRAIFKKVASEISKHGPLKELVVLGHGGNSGLESIGSAPLFLYALQKYQKLHDIPKVSDRIVLAGCNTLRLELNQENSTKNLSPTINKHGSRPSSGLIV
jgi:hypothetical protein